MIVETFLPVLSTMPCIRDRFANNAEIELILRLQCALPMLWLEIKTHLRLIGCKPWYLVSHTSCFQQEQLVSYVQVHPL